MVKFTMSAKRKVKLREKDFESEEYLGKLNAITGRLAGAFPGEPLGREDVAKVILELLQGHEETLGAASKTPRPMVKLSMRHWQDYTPGGSLFMIVRRCVRFKLKKGLRRFDWQSEHKRTEFVAMLKDCAEELREKGLLGHTKVYVSGDVPAASRDAAKQAARAMGAVLAASANDQGVTHVIHADLNSTDGAETPRNFPEGPDQCVVRGVVGKEALVHYVGYPESYDAWLSVGTAREHAARDKTHRWDAPPADDSLTRAASGDHLAVPGRTKPPKHVHYNWIIDSVKHNEWCEEGDYAWEDPAETAMRAATRAREAANKAMAATTAAQAQAQVGAPKVGDKRKGGPGDAGPAVPDDVSQGTAATGTAGMNPPPPEDERVAPPQFAERLGPHVVRQQLTQPHSSVAAAAENDAGKNDAVNPSGRHPGGSRVAQENISRGQMGGAAKEAAAVAATVAAAVAPIDEGIDADANGGDGSDPSSQDEPYKIPGHSHWFRWDATHELEKQGVPEFFDGRSENKTPETYRTIRAAMMNRYRAVKSSGECLRFTRARRGLVGDVNSLQRVFDFLERWGLINWRPRSDPERAAGLGANVPRVVAVDVVRPERPDAGTFSAANVALYRFPPTPLNGAATSVAEAEATELAAELAAEQAGARRGRPPINPRPEQPAPVIEVPLAAHAVLYGNQGNVKRACVGCDADITGKGTAYYHCAKPPIKLAKASVGGVDVCGRCFSAGKLPDGTTSGSFLRTVAQGASSKKAKRARTVSVNEDGEEVTDDDDEDDESDAEMEQDDWTDQETLLLLEALELHGESWAEVATHVGTKSVEECIRRFIRLPIEERFLDELDPNALDSSRDPTDVRGGGDAFSTDGHRMGRPEVHLDESPNDLSVPFAGAPNPVMSNVAFLATCVAPRVAAAAARAALEAMDEEAGADAMDVDVDGKEGTHGGKTAKDIPVTDAKGREAAATGLAAAAVRAKLLADAEEREIQRLVISVAEAQMKKIEAKMRGFEDLETGLVKEREHLERMKARLFAERAELRVHKLEHEESVARAKEAQEKREATAATN